MHEQVVCKTISTQSPCDGSPIGFLKMSTVPVCKRRLQKLTSFVLHTQSQNRALCVSIQQLFLTCGEVFHEGSRVLGRLPALSLYCRDPLSSPLSRHCKREESKAIPISVAIHAAIGSLSTTTNYSLQCPSLLLPTRKQFHVTRVTSRSLIALPYFF